MRIAVDARELSGHPTGVGRYLAELLRAWDDLPGALGHDFALCAASPVTTPPLPRLRVSHHVAPGRGPWWEQRALPRLANRANADILFAPAYSGPLFPGMPMVVTIHDVSFAAHPEWFAPREGLRRRLTTRAAAWRARRVLTVSELTANVRRLIEKEIGQVWVTGEVTNLRTQSSGHIYFTLKDAAAQLGCVLFRSEAAGQREFLKDGQKVLLQGSSRASCLHSSARECNSS